MNFFDVAISLIVVCSAVVGVATGFISSVFSFAGWVASVLGAYWCYPLIEAVLLSRLKYGILTVVVGHLGLLIIFLVLCSIFVTVCLHKASLLKKDFTDRIFGALFGTLRGLLISVILLFTVIASVSLVTGKKRGDGVPSIVLKSKSYVILAPAEAILASCIDRYFIKRFSIVYGDVSGCEDDSATFTSEVVDELEGIVVDCDPAGYDAKTLDRLSYEVDASELLLYKLIYFLDKYDELVRGGKIPEDKQLAYWKLEKARDIAKGGGSSNDVTNSDDNIFKLDEVMDDDLLN